MNKQQSGFTLIEMVIVIILLGILAAVAVPKLSDMTGQARAGVQQGTLGALKSAWAIAYAVNKTVPTQAQLIAQMLDPACLSVSATTITCAGVMQQVDGTQLAVFTTGAAPATPSAITISTP